MYPSTSPIIVGIGASAGGLESMLKLFSGLRPNGRMAYVVAQHMAKDGHIELVLRLLNRQQNLPVIEAQANDPIEADRIYLIPPGCIGRVQKGRIQLLPTTAEYISTPSVNALFSAIANETGRQAIGIVLSGTGMDGLSGCQAIKAHGGTVITQSIESAAFPGMPQTVAEAGISNHALKPEDIARHLNAMFPSTGELAAAYVTPRALTPAVAVQPLAGLISKVFDATGVDFSSYKEETLQRRIDRRISMLQLASFEEYQRHIEKNPRELHVLQHLFLVSLSSFFRDSGVFAAVRAAMAELLAAKKPGDFIRIWVPGCASGEECYSLGILLAETLGGRFASFDIEITGSDLNPDALAIAESGSYRMTAFKETAPDILGRYFDHKGQHYYVKEPIRGKCRFIKEDVVTAEPPANVDMVSCRNLLIYMKSSLQDDLFRKFHRAMRPQGLLLIGQSENIGAQGNTLFTAVDHFHRLYRRKN